jgi:predicted nucleic acid-binding Zn ribbon protein
MSEPRRPDSRRRRSDGTLAKVEDVLGGLLKELQLEEALAAQDAVVRWAGVVGPGIAEVTRATGSSTGVLFVEVRSSAWMSELNLMRHALLERLNAGVREGRIEKIVFRLAPEGAFDGESD